jgi:ureidoglycolate lyase
MTAAKLAIEPLTAAAFEPFGQVIEADQARSFLINGGRTRRFDALAFADCDPAACVALSIFRGTPWMGSEAGPIRIGMLERHPLGSQAFVPMQPHTWLVVVAERPEPEACRAFLARGDQGIQIARGVWHHPLLVLRPVQDFLVVDRKGPGENLEEVHFPPGSEITLDKV